MRLFVLLLFMMMLNACVKDFSQKPSYEEIIASQNGGLYEDGC
jgi:hypothetical protein